MTIPQEILEALCAYDIRNPDNVADEDTVRKEPCYCDNCFYDRNKLALACILLLTVYNSKENNELEKTNTR